MENLSAYGRIIWKWGYELGSSISEQESVASPCEPGNLSTDFINFWKFLISYLRWTVLPLASSLADIRVSCCMYPSRWYEYGSCASLQEDCAWWSLVSLHAVDQSIIGPVNHYSNGPDRPFSDSTGSPLRLDKLPTVSLYFPMLKNRYSLSFHEYAWNTTHCKVGY
jgi:hypothetical protein